jgi:predicted nucleotidyltransferase
MMHPDLVIDALQRWAASRPDVDAVWLFGSRAKGTAHPSSDVDIAILFAREMVPGGMARLNLIVELSDFLTADVDVVILNSAGELIVNQILRFGKRVYTRREVQTALFELAAYGKYGDYAVMKSTIIDTRKRQIHGQS